MKVESGSLPSDSFLAELNSLLIQYPLRTSLNKQDGKILRESLFDPRKPSDFWVPIVDAAADLLSETETSRLRQCESCVVHFFDTSKKGSRRWCSMNICGNKLKVAAYQRRKRARDGSEE
jgi:predicted RNA-binding Zn ribbon-like protein